MLNIRFPLFLIIVILTLIFISHVHTFASNELQTSPQTPKVPTEQQTKSSLKAKEKANQIQKNTANAPIITPTNQSNEIAKKSDNDGQKSTNGGTEFCVFFGYKFRVTDLALVAFTFLLFICTGILAWIAYRQYRTTVSSQRAFVFVDNIVYPNPVDINFINDFWRINVIWKNSGLTPTKNLMGNINWRSFKNKIFNDFDFPDAVDHKPLYACIGPKAIIHSDYVDIPITYFDGQNRVYIWGWVDYNDVFDKKSRHRTEFCYEIIMNWTKRFDPRMAMRLRPHHKHNGSDDECCRKPSPYTPPT